MNKSKFKLFISIICVFLLILFTFSTYSHATSNWWEDGKNFIDKGKNPDANVGQPIDKNQIRETLMPIGKVLVTIATITVTVVTVVMGIKYMMCDNANEQAKLKKQLIGLVVSTIVIYGAQFIWAILYQFMSGVTG